MQQSNAAPRRPIAVVGAACRLPGGVNSLRELWSALEEGRDLVGEAPPDRFEAERFVDTGVPRPGKSYTAAGGFLADVASFDAAYFGISPAEAEQMDPQHRLLLELAAEALDDAAIAPRRLAGSDTAVYVGISDASYGALQLMAQRSISPYTMSGGASSLAANRLSYAFDLRGPSMAVDTACSSSLIALDRACHTLWEGTSHVAVCGGANLLISPYHYVGFSQASMLSVRGVPAPFSARADGFVRAEGGGVVILKPLEAALADGDRVHGVILGTGANSDGRTLGIALPNDRAQEDLLRQVYARAGVDPDELVYFEAHGTGTPAGDPLEAMAIGRALGSRRITGDLPFGSVKSNLGHLEPASGMAGLCKALLVLRHGTIPATLHADEPSPHIDFPGLGLELTTTPRPVAAAERPVVGVNSFGFGGANAHAIVSAAPVPAPRPADPGVPPGAPLPVLVSARDEKALAEAATAFAEHLADLPEEEFYDVAHTTCRRRGRHEHRALVLARTPGEASRAFAELAGADRTPPRPEPGGPVGARAQGVRGGRVAFVLCGNGSQWAGMGADLLARDADFRSAVEEFDAHLTPRLGWSVAECLAAPPEDWRLAATEVAQPLLCAVQLGIAAALRARGVEPAMVVGHSVGEVAAAHLAGALTLAQTARVVAERGAAQAPTAGLGRMAAVGLGEEEARALLAPYGELLEIAAVGGDRDVTVSGDAGALAALGEELARREVFFRDLGLDYAFHSRAMDGRHDALTEALAGLEPSAAALPMYSTVTADRVLGPELDARYWWHNVRRPVRFGAAVERALDDGADILLEVGPHPVLRGSLRRLAAGRPAEHIAVLPTMRREADAVHALDTACAALLAAGAEFDWERLLPAPGRVADLPAYPWQRQRHWKGTPQSWVRSSGDGVLRHPLLGERLPAPQPVWQGAVEPVLVPWLSGHRVGGSVVMPATAYLEMALAAGREALDTAVEVEHMDISNALVVPWPDAGGTSVQASLNPDDGTFCLTSTTENSGQARHHARARVRAGLRPRPEPLDVERARRECPEPLAAERFYGACDSVGLCYGPAFRVLEEMWCGPGTALAAYRHDAPGDPYTVHPALLDGALQTGVALLLDRIAAGHPYLPSTVAALRVWKTPAPQGLMLVRERARTDDEVCWDILLTDEDGTVAAELEGCRLRRLQIGRIAQVGAMETVLRAAPHKELPRTPVPLPAPAELVERAGRRIGALRAAWRDAGHGEAVEDMQRYTAARYGELIAALLDDADKPFAVADLIARGLPARHGRLFDLLGPFLERQGVWRAEDDRWRLCAPAAPASSLLAEFVARHPAFASTAALTARQLQTLADSCRDGADAAEATVSDSAARMLEQYYDVSPLCRFHNRVAQALVERMADAWPADRALRVLEIGAGTGGTTAALLPLLPADRTHYTFTDVSTYFLTRAETHFAAYDFVEYAALDLDRDPAEQGLAAGEFDLIVASNALHTAADLRESLRRVRSLLAPGGQLLAFETHDAEVLAPVFGALDSFYAHTDRELRPGSLLLPRDEWPRLLAESGFDAVTRTGGDEPPLREGWSVFLAAAPAEAEAPDVALPPADGAGTYLIAAEQESELPLARALGGTLEGRGAGAVRTVPLPGRPEEWEALLTEAVTGAKPVETVVVTVLLGDEPGDETGDGPDAVAVAARRASALGALATAGEGLPDGVRAELWLVTRPCGALPALEEITHPEDAAVWGVARTLANEHPALVGRRVSLRRGDAAADALRLAREMLAAGDEDEIVLTASDRFVPRERPRPEPSRPAGDTPFALRVRRPGLSYELVWEETPVPAPPGPGEVLVDVRASALNYRDVMKAVGLLPAEVFESAADSEGVGLECAGVVLACGPGVTGFAPGDRVVGMTYSACASHAVMQSVKMWRLADEVSFAEAAAAPIAVTTVQYSLGDLARLQPGETVLIHGAAGGVGLAAVGYATHKGARVIATAGSDLKRTFLRSLGVEHVLDSRTLDFAEQVRGITGGQGVDVVLNSLAGEAMARSLELLKPGGRFVELGKRDFYENKPLLLRPFTRNIAFFGADVSQIPDHCFPRMRAEMGELASGSAHVKVPHTAFPAARVAEAFALLQHSRHLGKVVITYDPLDEPLHIAERPAPPRLDPEGSYLVTGGTGGFGAATACWLAELGARHLALVSRRGELAPEAAATAARLTELGARVSVHAADVTDPEAVRAVLAELEAAGRPLRGIAHAAMHLDDASLSELSEERIRAALAPKMAGARVLESAAAERGAELDLFLLHSSGTVVIGNIKQAPYVGANLYLEALARRRRQRGETALAIGWGPISDSGYVARNALGGSMEQMGIKPTTAADSFAAAAPLLTSGADVAPVLRVDWSRLPALIPQMAAPRLRDLAPAGAGDALSREELLARLAAMNADDALEYLRTTLAGLLAEVLRLEADQLDPYRRLDDYGMDSLMAAQVLVNVHQRYGVDIPPMELLRSNGTIDDLSRILHVRLGLAGQSAPAAAQPRVVAQSRTEREPEAADVRPAG
ncbi:SDR family NAD(P)-dependent oxidoreductase [Streptomyces sp. NPDC050617]|uniref:SDR family NAD(P)-dependent oxidoreductase n=1 Tax=Streptomyces sp. NPDC050617 TaxID=3154628 RepID=UPI00343179AC